MCFPSVTTLTAGREREREKERERRREREGERGGEGGGREKEGGVGGKAKLLAMS